MNQRITTGLTRCLTKAGTRIEPAKDDERQAEVRLLRITFCCPLAERRCLILRMPGEVV
jgi:hypothetical protein